MVFRKVHDYRVRGPSHRSKRSGWLDRSSLCTVLPLFGQHNVGYIHGFPPLHVPEALPDLIGGLMVHIVPPLCLPNVPPLTDPGGS